MLERYKNNRIKFKKDGVQKNFILNVQNKLKIARSELSQKLNVCSRTLIDWTEERITMTENAARKMSEWSGLPIPKGYSIIDYRLRYKKAGRIGARAKLERYGNVIGSHFDEQYRKKKWMDWWNRVGSHKNFPEGFQTLIKIKIPPKSKLLAEFIGILLGDGHIAKYQVTITLSTIEVAYVKYVCKMIKKLFDITPTILNQNKRKAVTIVMSRKLLVDFCERMAFKQGNKIEHQVDVPEWIKKNKTYALECIRGLFDTDGCFFLHTYIVNGKRYSYPKIAFTSASFPLLRSVEEILINLGFSVRMSNIRANSRGRDIRIDNTTHVVKYVREISSHNQKHLDKIKKWKVALNGKAAVC